MTDHPDRNGAKYVNGQAANEHNPNGTGINGEWMHFEQNEAAYYPGEQGNNPFERSK